MRKIIAGLFASIDGIVENPLAWNAPYFNEELGQIIGASMAEADALLLATNTYRLFMADAPNQPDNPIVALKNSKHKYVVSNSLKTLAWQNSSLIDGKNWIAEVTQLKQQTGSHILVPGSPTLVRSLIQARLLDELRIVVCPVVVGTGLRLFDGVTPMTRFNIVDAKTISTGAVALTYVPIAS